MITLVRRRQKNFRRPEHQFGPWRERMEDGDGRKIKLTDNKKQELYNKYTWTCYPHQKKILWDISAKEY